MAHERVTVCLPPCERGQVLEVLAEAMAPYDYNAPLPYPPGVEGEWDTWMVDSANMPFRLLPGYSNDPRVIIGLPVGSPHGDPPEPPFCDGGPRGILDFETPRAEAAAEAEARWRAWHEFAAGFPPAKSWYRFFVPKYMEEPEYSKAQALEDFKSQPVIKAVRADPVLDARFGGDPPLHFAVSLEEYRRAAALDVLPTTALLTLDGRWIRGFGGDYREVFNDYLDRLPADAYVVRVWYHG